MLVRAACALSAAAPEQTAGRMLGAISVGCIVIKEVYFKYGRKVFIYPWLMSARSTRVTVPDAPDNSARDGVTSSGHWYCVCGSC